MDAVKLVGKQWVIETDRNGHDAKLIAGPCSTHDALVAARSHRRLISARQDLYPDRFTFTIPTRSIRRYGLNEDGSRITLGGHHD